jgi:hypothetical protein
MKILGAACIAAYLLAMCLPAIAARGYHTTYLLHGWEVTYICGLFSFAPSMNLEERAPFILGTLSNFLFLFSIVLFVVRVLLRRPWPRYVVICLISAAGLVFSVISVLIAGMWVDRLLGDSYLWIASPILLFLGSLNECVQKGKAGSPSRPL